jgi:hypothetical protein
VAKSVLLVVEDAVNFHVCGARVFGEGCPEFDEVIHKGFRYVAVYNVGVTILV